MKSAAAMFMFLMAAVLPSYATAAREVRQEMFVSTEWLSAHLDDANVVVLHVATDANQYEKGHIPGARYLPWEAIATTRDGVPNELPPVEELQRTFEQLGVGNERRIVLYGDRGAVFAARGYVALDYLGHGERAALLDGGIQKWKAEGRPVETKAAEYEAEEFTPRINKDVVVEFGAVKQVSEKITGEGNTPVVLIDARPKDQYTGEVPGEGIAEGGHIPGAINIYWEDNVVTGDYPVALSPELLREYYGALGISPEDQVITYCRTGGQASYAYVAAKYLGHETRIYDGSYYEWSRKMGGGEAAEKESERAEEKDPRALLDKIGAEIEIAETNSLNRLDPVRHEYLLERRKEAVRAFEKKDIQRLEALAWEIEQEVKTGLSFIRRAALEEQKKSINALESLRIRGADEGILREVENIINRADERMTEDRDYIISQSLYRDAQRLAERAGD